MATTINFIQKSTNGTPVTNIEDSIIEDLGTAIIVRVGSQASLTLSRLTSSTIAGIDFSADDFASPGVFMGALRLTGGDMRFFASGDTTNAAMALSSNALRINQLTAFALGGGDSVVIKPAAVGQTKTLEIRDFADAPYVTFRADTQRLGINTVAPGAALEVVGDSIIPTLSGNTVSAGNITAVDVFATG